MDLEPPADREALQQSSGNGSGVAGQPTLRERTMSLAMWIVVAGLSMMFAALAIMYVFRSGDRLDYRFDTPKSLYFSTAAMVLSSITMHGAVLAIRRGHRRRCAIQLSVTLALGGGFVVSQIVAWRELVAQGVYAQSNPFSGLFYILTGVHGLHVLVGLVWLAWVGALAFRMVFTARRHIAIELAAIYWHLMDAVWICFFILLMYL